MLVASAVLLTAGYLAFSRSIFGDGDTGWHLAAGDWIIAHRRVPAVDPFSFTFRGHRWVAHEWLAEVVLAAVRGAAGWGGLAVVTAVTVAATVAIAGLRAARAVPPRYLLLALALLVGSLAPGALVRPHVLAWALLALWLAILLRARDKDRAPPIAAALLVALWVNVHASYILGLGIAAALAAEALIEGPDRRRIAVGWGLFGLASLGASLLNPHGIDGFLYPFQVSGMRALPVIGEWRSATLPQDMPFALLALATAAVGIMRWRRIGWVRLGLAAGLVAMGVLHARHQALFALVTVMVVLPRAFDGVDPTPVPRGLPFVALAAAAVIVVRLAIPLGPPSTANWPLGALAAVPPSLRAQPVLNSYSFGGPMILSGIAPYIDGRADMYGDAFTLDHYRMTEGDMSAFDRAAARWGLRWAILGPAEPLVARLDRHPDWHRIYADRQAVVFVRTGATPRPPSGVDGAVGRVQTARISP